MRRLPCLNVRILSVSPVAEKGQFESLLSGCVEMNVKRNIRYAALLGYQ